MPIAQELLRINVVKTARRSGRIVVYRGTRVHISPQAAINNQGRLFLGRLFLGRPWTAGGYPGHFVVHPEATVNVSGHFTIHTGLRVSVATGATLSLGSGFINSEVRLSTASTRNRGLCLPGRSSGACLRSCSAPTSSGRNRSRAA